jgi:NADH:ubiquinone oxidoreductase subunit E
MSDLEKILAGCTDSPPNILAALQKVQAALGYVPHEAVPKIAALLRVTDSDVAGVLSFYHDLRTEKPGKHVVKVCLGDSCRAMNCEETLAAFEKKLGCKLGETTKDGRYTLEKVYCLGNCALSPSVMVGEDLHARVTPRSAPNILKEYK